MFDRLYTYRRSLLVGGVSFLLFGWCAVAASPKDNARFIGTLHEGHRGTKYQDSLQKLNERVPAGRRMNECNVCHTPQGWVENLIRPLGPVETAACTRCHKVDDKDPDSKLGKVQGQRLVRTGHLNPAPGAKETDKGLRVDPETGTTVALKCAFCHPDHQREKSVQKAEVEVDKAMVQRIVMTDSCLGCHVPTHKGPRPDAVMKLFIDSHEAIFEAGEFKTKDRAGILDAMSKQTKVAEKACMPACHDEHKPQYGDAS